MSSREPLLMAAIRRVRVGSAYRRLFAGPDGAVVLADLLHAGGVLATSQDPDSSHATAFAEGRRSLALHILDRLRWTEADIVKLAQRTADQERQLLAEQEE